MTELLENTVGRLRQLLADEGAVAEGRLPSERRLADELEVSRRTLRQALAVLEIEGRVVRRQGSGTFVAASGAMGMRSAADAVLAEAIERIGPLEVLEVRLSIEPTLARLAALRASAADIDELGALAEATRVAKTPRAYEQLDAAFHRRIALAARNALFLALFDSVLAAIDRGAWHGVRENAHCSKNKEVFSRFHKTLVEAIAGRAPDKAAETMFAHLCKVRDHLLAATYPPSIAARMDTA